MTCGSHRKVIRRSRKRPLREMRVNVMKGLCNSYTRSARGNAPSAAWKRLGLKTRAEPWL